MPLASAANLGPVLGVDEDWVRRMLGVLRRRGWVASVCRGMTERRQHRWFLTSRAVNLLYVTGHQHPSPREENRARDLAEFHPEGELPEEFQERFALNHAHPVHLEDQESSPFAAGGQVGKRERGYEDHHHEHPPWTATSRGIEISLRRLSMLEAFYRLAPDLLLSGKVRHPAGTERADCALIMTDFRLLRYGGFYHAVARYGSDVWTPFTYAGVHATERVLRRKEQHCFWNVDCYSHQEDRYFRIGNRLFYEDPDKEVEPSALVVVAADAWAGELARNTLSGSTPTVFCTPDGRCSRSVELCPSRDLVSDPSGHPVLGRPEDAESWLKKHPDMDSIDGRTAHRLFVALCQFPAIRASWLREIVRGSPAEIARCLKRFVDNGLVAVFDRRHYLSELGMKRAANMSRVRTAVIRNRHGAYLDRRYREHELRHNDGVNGLLMQFAREGVDTVAGWRGEINIPGLTQVRPDLLVQVAEGALGAGTYYIEYERYVVRPAWAREKLVPYRKMAAIGRPLPTLMVCEAEQGEEQYQAASGRLPMLTATLERALAGPLTGAKTVWQRNGEAAALHSKR